MRVYAQRLMGSCRTGSDSSGDLFHAVPEQSSVALCGRTYGRRSAGWSSVIGDAVTCPKCLRKMQRMAANVEVLQ